MKPILRAVLLIGLFLYYIIILRLLKKKRLTLKYTLLWLLMGILMLIFIIFPGILGLICSALGIIDGMNGLFTFILGFVVLLLMALTGIVSKQSEHIKDLTQENALLEKRMRDIEKLINKE